MPRTLDHATYRLAIRQADMLVRRARDRARERHLDPRSGSNRLKRSGEELVRILNELAEEIWALAEDAPADCDAAYEFDRNCEEEWLAVNLREAPTHLGQGNAGGDAGWRAKPRTSGGPSSSPSAHAESARMASCAG